MADATQATRPLAVNTPLGEDALLLLSITGQESLSQLFRFQLEAAAPVGTDVPFDQLLGQGVTVRLELSDQGADQRYFVGICSRVTQGESDDDYTTFFLEMVPPLWLLTRRAQSRIFQHKNVPDILKEVFAGVDFEDQTQGTFEPRDFCVQYRETDFNFASRLMEEEGIYYYFQHSDGACKMIVANTPGSHTELEGEFTYRNLTQGATMDPNIIYDWGKTQELASGKYTLWDHTFELPHKHLEAERPILDSVAVGGATHKLALSTNAALEIYDYPGEYAQRFDGIDKGGGEQPAEVQKNFDDNQRTVNVRMQQEAAASVIVQGASNARVLSAGHKMNVVTLDNDAASKPLQVDGAYVLTAVSHSARMGLNFKSGDGRDGFQYANRISCIPAGLPFRPQRTTPKPVVAGSQTAVVVGPPGEEIFTDKYSRVKVQFHWDRAGKNDADSSCWVRVATVWAGKQWGVIHIPRIGQEVIVDFLEGDPDQPIIVGSVYNAEMMPPYKLPDNKTQSGVVSRSSLKGTPEDFNEICFEDKKGEELLYIRAQKDQTIAVENDEAHWVGHDRLKTVDNDETVLIHRDRKKTIDRDEDTEVKGNRTEVVRKNETITVEGSRKETVVKDEDLKVQGNRRELIEKDHTLVVSGARGETVDKDETLTVKGKRARTVKQDENVTVEGSQTIGVGKSASVDAKKNILINAGDQITIKTGDASITMKKNGEITIKGKDITIEGSGKINVKASSDVVIKGSNVKSN